MAKITIEGNVYEGTAEELRELFEMMGVKFPTQEVAVTTPKHKTEKRPAKVGERILITYASPVSDQKYSDGDVLTVIRENACAYDDVAVEGQPSFIDYTEYEVIVEPAQAKPKLITHKGADYTLVQRKAQAGDVVYVTKDAEGTAIIPNDAKYLVDESGKIEGYDVYPKLYNRTEANVLVYEKVAKEEPKVYPQNGDIVRVTRDYFDILKKGTLGEVVKADGTDRPRTEFDSGEQFHPPVEIVAHAKDRVDVA